MKPTLKDDPQISKWYEDLYTSAIVSRNRWFLVGVISMVLMTLSVIAVIVLVPLKEVQPFMIQVAENGIVTTVDSMKEKKLTEIEALTKFFLVKYVAARETYDPQDLSNNYEQVKIMSAPEEAGSFDDYLRSSDSPIERYKRAITRGVRISSVSFLNKKTAQVRFSSTETQHNEKRKDYWVAILSFRYVNSPMEEKERFENPLGFQVYSYRVDQEVVK